MSRSSKIRKHYEPRLTARRENYDILNWASAESQQTRFAILAANVPLGGKSLLDIGCGLGDLWAFLKRLRVPVAYTGVDIVPAMVAEAQRGNPDARFVHADVFDPPADPPFAPGEFDVVFCSGALNLNLGNNGEFLPHAVAAMIALARETAAFNLLHVRAADHEDRYFYYDPADVHAILADTDCEVRILDDYLPNDFTVICRKP